MVINMAIGLAVQTDSAAIGVILLFFLFAFWAGELLSMFHNLWWDLRIETTLHTKYKLFSVFLAVTIDL